jgi:hypothetical protein
MCSMDQLTCSHYQSDGPDPNPLAPATVEGAHSVGIHIFENPNGRMMEEDGGVSISDVLARNGKRQSVFRSYTFPLLVTKTITSYKELAPILPHENEIHLLQNGTGQRFKIFYREAGGTHAPAVLLLHGLPTVIGIC